MANRCRSGSGLQGTGSTAGSVVLIKVLPAFGSSGSPCWFSHDDLGGKYSRHLDPGRLQTHRDSTRVLQRDTSLSLKLPKAIYLFSEKNALKGETCSPPVTSLNIVKITFFNSILTSKRSQTKKKVELMSACRMPSHHITVIFNSHS